MLHTVSAKPYTSRKTCPQLSPPSTSSSPARNVSKPTRETLNVQRPARALPQISALSLRGKLRVFKAAVSVCPRCAEKEKKGCETAQNTQKVVHLQTHRLTPKQLKSHPVIQSDCLATPIAASVCVCFSVAASPEIGGSSHGRSLLLVKIRPPTGFTFG